MPQLPRKNPPSPSDLLRKLKKGIKTVADEISGHGGSPNTPAGIFGGNAAATEAIGAVRRGDGAVLKKILDEKPDALNGFDQNGETPLLAAIDKGDTATVKLLLDAGADPSLSRRSGGYSARIGGGAYRGAYGAGEFERHLPSEDKPSPLFHAATKGLKDIAELLISRKADPKAQNDSGVTALHVAAQRGHTATVKLLLDKGADATAVDTRGNTALHYAALAGHRNAAEELLKNGASARTANHQNNTPLHFAAQSRDTQMAQLLLKHGGDANATNANGKTPLDLSLPQFSAHAGASLQSYYDTASALIRSGAKTDRQDKNTGETVLHRAASGGHTPLLQVLLDKGADPDTAADNGDTALIRAARSARGGHYNRNYDEAVVLLLHYGASPDAADGRGETPLLHLCRNGRADLAKKLLDAGADVNARAVDGATPLTEAVQSRNAPLVKMLLQAGADLRVQKNPGETLIEYAKKRNAPQDIVTILREWPQQQRKLSQEFRKKRLENRGQAQKQHQQNIRQYTRRDPKTGGGT